MKEEIPAVDQLIDQIQSDISRYGYEADITYAEIIGALELIKHDVIDMAKNSARDPEEE